MKIHAFSFAFAENHIYSSEASGFEVRPAFNSKTIIKPFFFFYENLQHVATFLMEKTVPQPHSGPLSAAAAAAEPVFAP
jgi:hypothetical protein